MAKGLGVRVQEDEGLSGHCKKSCLRERLQSSEEVKAPLPKTLCNTLRKTHHLGKKMAFQSFKTKSRPENQNPD